MAQFIKYETTTIDAGTSALGIRTLVKKYGGRNFQMTWLEDEVDNIRFEMPSAQGFVPIRLAPAIKPIFKLFRKNRPSGDPNVHMRQARRIAWRHLKDLTEQQLLAASIGLADPASVFMASLETTRGTTVGQEFIDAAMARGGLRPALGLPPAGGTSEAA